jgi:iron(III) transport system permease protein
MDSRRVVAVAVGALAVWVWASEPPQRRVLLVTVVFCLAVGALIALIAPWLFWLVERSHRWVARLAWLVWTCALFVPIYVQTAAWQAGIGPGGWAALPPASTGQAWLRGWLVAVGIHAAAALPWALWLLRAGAHLGHRVVWDAARLLTTPGRMFWYVGLVEWRPWIVLGAVWASAWASSELFVADLYLVPTVARQIYTGFAVGSSVRSALWLTLGQLFAALLVWPLVRQGRWWRVLRWESVPDVRRAYVSEPPLTSASLIVLLALLVTTFLPLAGLVFDAGAVHGLDGRRYWTLQHFVFRAVDGFSDFRREIVGTLLVSLTATVVAAVVALGGLCFVYGRRWEVAVWIAVFLVLVTPGPLVGILLAVVMRRPELPLLVELYDRTLLAPVVATAVRIFPLVWTAMYLGAQDIPHPHRDMAYLEGCSRAAFFTSGAWPWMRNALVAGSILGFCWASGELAATLIVIPPGGETVAVRIANLLHTGVRDKEAMLCLWHVAVCVLLVGLLHGSLRCFNVIATR